MQQAFHDNHALQCGYCTPGMIMQALRPAQGEPEPDRAARSGWVSRATCAAAPATTTSSRPSQACASTMAAGGGAVEDDSGRRWRRPMTAVDDRPATEIGSARKRKEDQRLITGRTRWTDNIQLPGMLHLAMVRSPFAHATITAIDTTQAKAAPGRHRRLHRQRPRRGPGRRRRTPGRSTTTRRHPPTCPSPSTASPAPARSSPSSPRAPPRPHGTPPSSSTSTTTSCRRCSTPGRPLQGRGAGAPRPRHEQVGVLAARLRRRGHGG